MNRALLQKLTLAPSLLLLVSVFTGSASAQVAIGTPPFGSFGGGPDTINLGNGNAHWTVPVFHKPGRGTNFNYDLNYDSSVYGSVTSNGTTTWAFANGWTSSILPVGYLSERTTFTTGACTNGQRGRWIQNIHFFTYVDGFGTPHPFTAQWGDYSGCGQSITYAGSQVAPDGSGYTLNVTGGTVNQLNDKIGRILNVPINATGAGTVTDRNGNKISVNSSNVWTDTLGSTALTISGAAPSPTNFTYTLPSGGTNTATYAMSYVYYTVASNFAVTGIHEYGATPTYLVDKITLPDGTFYQFTYEQTPSLPSSGACTPTSGTYQNYCVTGRITKVLLPTGGYVSYAYSGGAGTNSSGIFSDGSTATAARTVNDGTNSYTWTYARTLVSGNHWQTIVTDPNNNQTAIDFQEDSGSGNNTPNSTNFFETQRRVYQGSTGGTLLQTTSTCYNAASSPCTTTLVATPITQRAVNVLLDMSGLQGYSVEKYNSSGTLAEVDSYGYGSGTIGPLLKKTIYSTASLGNITAFRNTVKVTDGSGNALSQTNYNYDETTPTPTTGVAQHTSVTGSRGNLTSVQSCTVVSTCSSYLAAKTTYDDTGQALSVTDSNGNQIGFSYADNFFTDNGANPPQTYSPAASTNAYLTSITVPIFGTSGTYGYYFNSGQTAISKDQNGADSYAHFDSVGRLATTYLPPRPDGNRGWTLSQYTNLNKIDTYTSISSTSPSASCTSCRHQQQDFDGSGRVTSDSLVNDPDGTTTVAFTYDSLGRVAGFTNPYRSTSDPTYGVKTPTYDTLGRIAKVTAPDGSLTYEYYGNAVASAGGASAQLCSSSTYGLGYPVLIVDASGKKRQHWTDGLGRMFEVDEADSSGNLTVATCNSFDLLNNLTQVVQGTQTRSYAYDSLSRPTSETTPEAGTVNFYYTTAGGALCSGKPMLVCRKTDARGITATNNYDTLNRLTSTTYSDTTPQAQYFYDQTVYNGLTIGNGKGRLTGMGDASGASAYSYDLLGQIIAENHTISGATKTISYTYNLDGSLASVTNPSGRVVTYTYSNAQRPVSALDSVSGNYLVKSGVYAPQGAQASLLFGYTPTFGGVAESFTYNNRLQLKNQAASSSAGTVLNLNYGFPSTPSNNGRVTTIVNNVDNGRTISASYDTLNRVASAQSQATSGADCWGQSYGYDRWANLLSISLTQCSGGTLVLSATNNRITNTGFGYDASGNMTTDGTYTYSYDAANHLTGAAGVSYVYDARDLRVKKSNGTLYWRGYLGDAIAESDLSGNIQSEYIFFGGQRIARIDSSGNAYYYFSDRLGSVRVVTNGSGSTCYNADFTPFGTELSFTNTCPQNYKFTGYERDSETGLDYAIYRNYSSRLGRFMQRDPLPGRLANPQSLNRYAYVLDDPLNWTDHLGLSPCPAGTHPATAAEAQSVIQAAQSYVGRGIDYGHGNNPVAGGSIDCSQLVARVANAVAGYSFPATTAHDIYAGNSPDLIESSDNGRAGDVVAFGGGYHVGIVASTNPFSYIASNGSVDQGKTSSALGYGPGQYSGFNDNPTQRRFYTLCIQDKATKPGNPASAGGTAAAFSGVDFLLDLVAPPPPPPPPPAATESQQVCVPAGACGDSDPVNAINVVATADQIDTTSVEINGPLVEPGDGTQTPPTDGGGAGGSDDSGGGGGGGGGGGDDCRDDCIDNSDDTFLLPNSVFPRSPVLVQKNLQSPLSVVSFALRKGQQEANANSYRPGFVNASHASMDWGSSTIVRKRESSFAANFVAASLLSRSRHQPTHALKTPSSKSAQELVDTANLCYAFLRLDSGEPWTLWTSCAGKKERVQVPFKILDFAVSSDGEYLAYHTVPTLRNGQLARQGDIFFVSLKAPFKMTEKRSRIGRSHLMATCGTILNGEGAPEKLVDLLGRDSKQLPQADFFQCSSNRKVTIEWIHGAFPDRGALKITRDGRETLKRGAGGVTFELSASGIYWAYSDYSTADIKVCIGKLEADASCDTPPSLNLEMVSDVSDSGEILGSMETTGCKSPAGVCQGITYWHPGMAKAMFIEKEDTRKAKWISAETAKRLHEWASTLAFVPPTK